MKYTFGTSESAEYRLEEIAKFFNPLGIEFIRNYINIPISSAIDLGCGPGFTTDMLYHATDCPNVYGFDTSANFIQRAAARFKQCSFIEHDVTQVPFPLQAELMYVRFLLSHLKDAVDLVNLWITQLLENGILIIEELEGVDTEVKVFNEYLTINCGLIESQGASLYVGNVLGNGTYNATVVYNECVTIPVANYQVATWFYPNTITIWEKEQFVLGKITKKQRKDISSEILGIKESKDSSEDSSWKIRRLVMKRN
jgi:SAM-dependent methyltransferase